MAHARLALTVEVILENKFLNSNSNLSFILRDSFSRKFFNNILILFFNIIYIYFDIKEVEKDF